jgi:hypothetical protein
MDEREYPIYKFWVTMSDPGWSTSLSRMYKEELTPEQQQEQLEEFVNHHLDRDRPGRGRIRDMGLRVVETGVRFERMDTWCIAWFNHYTFNVHLSDEELRESFRRFVAGKLPLHRNIDRNLGHPGLKLVTYCLMGAEEEWRWKGPCRCEHCVERGVTYFDH